jgi:leader peptidase (prepilin peptidase)/N-methyltransferase
LEAFWVVWAGIVGLFIGSFLNVLVYRIPRGEDFVKGRSHCPSCGHDLAGADLVPVFSYLALGRKCRYCRRSISGRYALVETLTGALFALGAWLAGGFSIAARVPVFLVLAAFLSISVVVVFIRIDRNRVPRALPWAAAALGAVVVALVWLVP